MKVGDENADLFSPLHSTDARAPVNMDGAGNIW